MAGALAVVNSDNGVDAAYLAHLINHGCVKKVFVGIS